jgi:hypothetical protein
MLCTTGPFKNSSMKGDRFFVSTAVAFTWTLVFCVRPSHWQLGTAAVPGALFAIVYLYRWQSPVPRYVL